MAEDTTPTNEDLERTYAAANWYAITETDRLRFILGDADTAAWYGDSYKEVLAKFRHDPAMWGLVIDSWLHYHRRPRDLESAIDAYLLTLPLGTNGHPPLRQRPPKETLTQLLAADIPAPMQLFEHLMHEGMLLFGGKSKRGKSWLMFDLALSLSVGRSGFRHFGCPQPRPVLYLALEDGRARLQHRAKMIQPNLTTADSFHLCYTYPGLAEGGIEILAEDIATHHYGLVVIDVLAKMETPKAGKSDKNYHDIYEMFTPLQELRNKHPFCLAMLTHLRKQDADDVFDSLLGSVAYQGAQDVLWVLERKPKDDFAFLHIRDKDAEDKTIALRFLDGHWEYVGEGEEYEVSRDQRKIIKVLSEERKEMNIVELMKTADFGQEKYAYVRKMLMMMVNDDMIHRTKRGHYSVTLRGSIEMGDVDADDERDDAGDRVPF